MVMIPSCQKRRTIVRREQDGSKRTYYQCAHGATSTYSQKVVKETCEGCVLRQEVVGRAQCNPKPPTNPTYRQPTYGQSAEIRYEPVDATEPPECPEGYTRRTEDDWVFDSVWFPCPYRAFSDDLKPDGSLQIRAFCIVGHKKVICEGCDKCKGELEQIDGSLEARNNPQTPALIHQARNYWKAVKKWIAAGRPIRSDEDVKKVHANYCLQCDWYDKPTQRCKGCGCKVKPKGRALLNKARMATEHCPRDFW